MTTFNLADHVMDLRGKAYLPVAPRIVAFRIEHPDWSITTTPTVFADREFMVATIADADGRIVATAHKSVTTFAGGALEKAETGAIGRALSLCGYGTLQALDLDEGDEIAEAPVARPARKAPPPAAAPDGWSERVKAAAGDANALAKLWAEVIDEQNAFRRAYAQAAIGAAFADAITAKAGDGMADAARKRAVGLLAEMAVVLGDGAQPDKARAKLDAAAATIGKAHDALLAVAS